MSHGVPTPVSSSRARPVPTLERCSQVRGSRAGGSLVDPQCLGHNCHMDGWVDRQTGSIWLTPGCKLALRKAYLIPFQGKRPPAVPAGFSAWSCQAAFVEICISQSMWISNVKGARTRGRSREKPKNCEEQSGSHPELLVGRRKQVPKDSLGSPTRDWGCGCGGSHQVSCQNQEEPH